MKVSPFIMFLMIMIIFVNNSFGKINKENSQYLFGIEMLSDKLLNILEEIPYGHEENFGFKSRTEFKLTSFGIPYQIFYLNDEFLPSDSIKNKNHIIRTDSWELPIKVDDKIRCFLHISKIKDSYEIVGLGFNEIANELNIIENQKIENLGSQNKSILYVPSMKAVYLIKNVEFIKNEFEYRFIPLQSTLKVLHNYQSKISTSEHIEFSLTDIIPVINSNKQNLIK